VSGIWAARGGSALEAEETVPRAQNEWAKVAVRLGISDGARALLWVHVGSEEIVHCSLAVLMDLNKLNACHH